jgi:hypothetical protein
MAINMLIFTKDDKIIGSRSSSKPITMEKAILESTKYGYYGWSGKKLDGKDIIRDDFPYNGILIVRHMDIPPSQILIDNFYVH